MSTENTITTAAADVAAAPNATLDELVGTCRSRTLMRTTKSPPATPTR